MVQTVKCIALPPEGKVLLLEKPSVLARVFFNVRMISSGDCWFPYWISFDDPAFNTYYELGGTEKYFEASGTDISQGDIWLWNKAAIHMHYSATEILH